MSASDKRSLFGRFALALAFLFIAVLYALIVNQDWVKQQIRTERQLNMRVLGDSAVVAERRGEGWFRSLFMKTGMVDDSYQLANGPGLDDDPAQAAMTTAFGGISDWAGERMEVVWMMTLQLCIRLSTCLLWWQYAAIVLVPFLIDAFVMRQIKRTSFTHASPHVFRLAHFIIAWLPIAFIVLLFAPTVLSPRLMPLMIVVLAAAVWTGIAQFAKRA